MMSEISLNVIVVFPSQRQLEEIEVRQRELEERGIAVEKSLRGDGGAEDEGVDESTLMSEWFTLVHEKNALLRYESELNVRSVGKLVISSHHDSFNGEKY